MRLYLKKSSDSARIASDESKSVDALIEDLPEDEKISKPFKSEAQRKKFHAMAARGEIAEETVDKWEQHTAGKKLPKRKKKMHKSLKEAIEILKAVGCSPKVDESAEELKKDEAEEVEKALKASAIASPSQTRLHNFTAGAGQEQPQVGTNRLRGDYETPVVPVRRVDQPFAMEPIDTAAILKSCGQCGYMHKSVVSCPRCTQIANMNGEALPLRFRGK